MLKSVLSQCWGSPSLTPAHSLLSYDFIRLSLHVLLFTVPEIQTRLSDTSSAPVLCSLSLSATDTLLCILWELPWKSTVGLNQKLSLCSSCKQTMWYCFTGYTSDSGGLQSDRERTSFVVFEGKYWSQGPDKDLMCPVVLSSWRRPVSSLPTFILSSLLVTQTRPELQSSTNKRPLSWHLYVEAPWTSSALIACLYHKQTPLFVQLSCSLTQRHTRITSPPPDGAFQLSGGRNGGAQPSLLWWAFLLKASTWTTCRTTSERRELCRGLETHRRHQQRIETGGIQKTCFPLGRSDSGKLYSHFLHV